MKIVAQNKKAFHHYQILETLEAGIVLTSIEIKEIRAGEVDLSGSFAKVFFGGPHQNRSEIWLVNSHIGSREESTKNRKLLLKKTEIKRLMGKIQEKNLTLVPLKLYLTKRGWAKVELGLARGASKYDKRQRLKQKHRQREMEREIGEE